MKATSNAVIQLDPDSEIGKEWGGLLCIVDESKDWGVKCYVLFPIAPGGAPAYVWLRVPHESYRVVGQAKFADWTERGGKRPRESRAQIRVRARSLAMFLCGYAYGFIFSLVKLLPPELAAEHEREVAWLRAQVVKLHDLNAEADRAPPADPEDEEAPDATPER